MNKDFHYNVNEIIDRKYGTLKILSQKRLPMGNNGKTCKGYNVGCLDCTYNFDIREGNLEKGDGCPVCSHHRVKKGINDVWTLRPDVAKWFTDSEDGYIYAPYSNKKIDTTCPFCGFHIGIKQISAISTSGISCSKCSDGVSFPNKFMFNFLMYLGEDFKTEQGYDWCIFPSYWDSNIMCHGIYDFIIPSRNLIIEMDGGLGHGFRLYQNSTKDLDELIYRDSQKDRLAFEHGYKLIRIKCDYYKSNNRFLVCKNGILNSELNKLFDLTNIPWTNIAELSFSGLVHKTCELYNNGKSSGEIAKILNKDQSTIIDYLHQGNEIGICNFIPSIQKPYGAHGHHIPVRCLQTNNVYDSIKRFKSMNKYGKYAKISKQEFNDIKKRFPNKAFGEYFVKELDTA